MIWGLFFLSDKNLLFLHTFTRALNPCLDLIVPVLVSYLYSDYFVNLGFIHRDPMNMLSITTTTTRTAKEQPRATDKPTKLQREKSELFKTVI